MKRLLLIFVLLLWLPMANASEAGFQEALEAYKLKDYKTAFKIFMPLAEQGDAESQYYIGFMYRYNKGVFYDSHKAINWLRKSAEQGLVKAKNQLAVALHWRGATYYGQAVEFYKKENNLGLMHEWHGSQDFKEATKHFYELAIKGNANGQNNLGWMYEEGKGIKRSNVNAYMWASIAKENGSKFAKKRINRLNRIMHKEDIKKAKLAVKECMKSEYKNCGTEASEPQNYSEAMMRLRKAIIKGGENAQIDIASLYQEGKGLLQLSKKALRNFRETRKKHYLIPHNEEAFYKSSDVIAKEKTGLSYLLKNSIPENLTLSYMWYSIAEKHNLPYAKSAMKKIREELPSANIEKAQQLAQKCFDSSYKDCE